MPSYYISLRKAISMRKGKDEKGREEKMKIRKMRGKAANSRATIAARKTNEPTINTRRTIGEAFDLVTPANQSLGRLIPHCTRSRVPVPLVLLPPTKQCLTAANFRNVHLGKTPFAPKWRPLTDPTRVSASPRLLSSLQFNASLAAQCRSLFCITRTTHARRYSTNEQSRPPAPDRRIYALTIRYCAPRHY